MASLPLTHFLSLPRWNSNVLYPQPLNFVQLRDFRSLSKWGLVATARRKQSEAETLPPEESGEAGEVKKKKTSRSPKKASGRPRKKPAAETPEEYPELVVNTDASDDPNSVSLSSERPVKVPRGTRRKAASVSSDVEEENTEKRNKRRGRRSAQKDNNLDGPGSSSEINELEDVMLAENVESESEDEIDLEKYGGEDISYTYGWPPLVCCFGAAQHAFLPSGRPSNRLIDYEIHERMHDAWWAPEKFVRAPGGCAGGVAIALASLGGKVAFMGKLGDDDYGQAMLYYLNINNVQTRSVRVDGRRSTAISLMKIGKRGRLKLTCVKPCAEDSLSKSEINVDVLKEAEMFYFSSQSLLDRKMSSTTLQAIKISKKLGSVIFFDVNLPLPMWQSGKEARTFIQEAWSLADVVEVTRQELEFLCGIEQSGEFDTKNNKAYKFVHYEPEIVKPLWHDNLKVLFVTNGTSKIHYYTKEHDGAVLGMEDAPLTPFTGDMSASGDGIVAGLMRMLTVQPDLITDKGYLERAIRYAIDCGVIDQWLLAQTCGYPPREDMEEEDEVEPDPYGIKSITEKEYRTLQPVGSSE